MSFAPKSQCTNIRKFIPHGNNHHEVLNMPIYEYKCLDCEKEVALALTLKEHESGSAKCPACGSKRLEQLITSFMARTRKKS
jgi:putative FmdB family regulatory protein